MRVLMLTPQLPYPPHQGTTIRNYNLIRQLGARHEVHLLSFVDAPARVELQRLTAHCGSICGLRAPQRSTMARARDTLLSALPDMALRLQSEDMHHQLGELLARNSYDVIQFEGIETGPYLLRMAKSRRGYEARPLIVFDDHNCEYLLQRRAFETDVRRRDRWVGALYSFIQWQKLSRYERRCCNAADRVVAVSRAEGRGLKRLIPGLEVTVVPNGVDVTAYDPRRVEPCDLGSAAIVFTGKMDFRPNVDGVLWFAQQVLPLVLAEIPQAHFYIVGQRPHSRLDVLRGDPAVTTTGFVRDTLPYIAGATVYVVPLRMGGGTRLKVLEAMALGKAMVSTGLGCEGFPSMRDGQHLLVEDDAAAFAQAVVALLRGPSRRRLLGQAARDLVCAQYDWERIASRLETVYSPSP
jgi:sugar transferase (PEP-CTERM/EpsH1 system associated)